MSRQYRFVLIAGTALIFLWALYQAQYEIAAISGLSVLLLIWSHYRLGTVMLASKAFQQKDYEKTERLLLEIRDPDRLARSRRGFYEFIYGNIELHRENFDEAERHFQIASRFPLRNENDKAIILSHLANLNLRKGDYEKTKAYTAKAKTLKITSRVRHIIEKIEKEIPK